MLEFIFHRKHRKKNFLFRNQNSLWPFPHTPSFPSTEFIQHAYFLLSSSWSTVTLILCLSNPSSWLTLFYHFSQSDPMCHAVLCLVAQSCPTLCNFMDCSLTGSSVHGDSPCKNTGVGRHALLQGIFLTQGWNPGLPHCRQILYHLSHQGSLRILEWVAYPFTRGISWPRNWTGVCCISGRFFTSWATWEARWTPWGTISTVLYLIPIICSSLNQESQDCWSKGHTNMA